MSPPNLLPALLVLIKETFEGIPPGESGTWFVQGKEGLFDALDTTTAKQASRKPSPQGSSIAAHVNHIRYALQLANSEAGGDKPEGTWESSWDIQAMSDDEWTAANHDIRREYEIFSLWLNSNQDWSDEDTKIYALSILPHMAYHLGAIRQVMKM